MWIIQFYTSEKLIIVQYHSLEKVAYAVLCNWYDQKYGNLLSNFKN